MFCQKCGAELSEEAAFCLKCGHKLHTDSTPRISNKAMLLAAIAAVASGISVLLSFLPGSEPTKARDTAPTPEMAVASPSPSATPKVWASPPLRSLPTPKPTLEPTPRPQRARPEPTPDYPYRHTPSLADPPDGAVFSHWPRKLVLQWRSISGSEADRYKVTVEYWSSDLSSLPGDQPGWGRRPLREIETPWNYCTIYFIGAQPGRWRVTPIFADGREGVPSEWRTFRFTR